MPMTRADLHRYARAGAFEAAARAVAAFPDILPDLNARAATNGQPAPAPAAAPRKRISDAGRRAISRAQKARWAKLRKKVAR